MNKEDREQENKVRKGAQEIEVNIQEYRSEEREGEKFIRIKNKTTGKEKGFYYDGYEGTSLDEIIELLEVLNIKYFTVINGE